MDLGLQGARVLVTGASAGLGRATAHQFSREGAIVVINSRNLNALQTTATEINAETGNLVYTIAGDVSVISEAEKVVRTASEMMGGLDVIVTNAGGPPAGTFDNFSVDDWRSATDLTFITHVALIKAALPYLRQSSRPAILTITSSAVKQPVDNLTLSNAIRPAVIGLTKTLSLELGAEGIRVNSILPGMTDTDRVDFLMKSRAEKNNTTPDEERQKAAQSIPLKRIGTPQEFANAAVFLCSPAAGFITGVSLPVDGGTIRATM
jgi:3-oxoacyl-[acyl-carrier protein] reductase